MSDTPPNDKGTKPEIPADIQDYVNELVGNARVSAREKAETAAKAKQDELQATIVELNTKLTGLSTELETLKKKGKKDGDGDGDEGDQRTLKGKLATLQTQFEDLTAKFENALKERDGLRDQISNKEKAERNRKLEDLFTAEASKMTFFDPKKVLKDVYEELRLSDNGRIEVLDTRTGDVRTDMENKPVTLENFLLDYAKKNPWMVEKQVKGGTGSEGTRKHDTATKTKSISDLDDKEFEAIEQKVLSGQKVDLPTT